MFGSWNAALEAAGLPTHRDAWTRAEALELQRGHRAGRVLDQHLVDAQREQLPVATLVVRVEEPPGERP